MIAVDQTRHDHAVEHGLGRPGHEQVIAGAIPSNLQRPPRQIEASPALAQPQQVAGHQGGASPRATGQGGAGAPLPDPHHQMAGMQHLYEVHVGACRELRMHLQRGPQHRQINALEIRHRNHDVGIAHADGGHRQDLARDRQLPLGQPRRTALQQGGNGCGLEERSPHVDPDPAIGLQLRHDPTRQGLDLPGAARPVPIAIGQEAGQAADAIAAHLRLGAIGIEDAHPQFPSFPGGQGEDHPVATHTEAAITQPLDRLRVEAEVF